MRINKILFTLLFLSLMLGACKKQSSTVIDNKRIADYDVKYAKGFTVNKMQDYTIIEVRNPWDTTLLLQKYILVDRDKEIPANLPQGTLIKIPVQSAITSSTIHCSTLKEIGALDIVRGVCELQYIKLDEIQNGVKNGAIKDLGLVNKVDIETIIMLQPEVIFTSPISGQSYGNIEKAKAPLIETIDYTEPDPLGRAEWIRFYSLFTGTESLADSLFDITVKNYNEVKAIVANVTTRPTVFTDMKYQSNWNQPGGKSYMANMLADAGADYVWKDDSSTGFLPLSFEAVLDKAGEADLWLIKYFAPETMTYESLKNEFKSYSYFNAFKTRNVFACNTQFSPYYEDLPIHPDWILKDMAYVFHTGLFPDYQPKYYSKVRE
ncbi:ABC transporter substrate-binding protein [Dysgonomonas sp. ZJ709]|uniref:ABC transporter substrate-binding protein n=1 Tax=Dysgonomonas sp. ZJ709 TaxID=2709797 RepID=UPI0013EE2D59|nr:ABC transporter substrate-binding protein [Dysgonomonas sp. ZJ709]